MKTSKLEGLFLVSQFFKQNITTGQMCFFQSTKSPFPIKMVVVFANIDDEGSQCSALDEECWEMDRPGTTEDARKQCIPSKFSPPPSPGNRSSISRWHNSDASHHTIKLRAQSTSNKEKDLSSSKEKDLSSVQRHQKILVNRQPPKLPRRLDVD
jgi:hypothetical protein